MYLEKEKLTYIRDLDLKRVHGWVNFNNKKKPIIVEHRGKTYKVINSSVKYINYLKELVDGFDKYMIDVNFEIDISKQNSIQVISPSAEEAIEKINQFIHLCEMLSKKENLGILIDLAEKKANGTLRVNKITSICRSDIRVCIHLFNDVTVGYDVKEACIVVKALSEEEIMFGIDEIWHSSSAKPISVLYTAQEMAEKYKLAD